MSSTADKSHPAPAPGSGTSTFKYHLYSFQVSRQNPGSESSLI